MTLQRVSLAKGTNLPLAAPPSVSVTSLGALTDGERWRTEAMRSYSRPTLFWVTRGQGRFTISGRQRGYHAYTMIFLPANVMHSFDFVGQVLGSMVFLPRSTDVSWPLDAVYLRIGDARRQMELTQQIEVIAAESRTEGPGRDAALRHLSGLLAVWLTRTISAEGDAAPEDRAAELVAAYTALVERGYRLPGGVGDYARQLGISPAHLSRVCRKTCGRAAHDILADRRQFEARRLLLDTDLAIADIARQSGYASQSYFTRAFRGATGQAPSTFRAVRRKAD